MKAFNNNNDNNNEEYIVISAWKRLTSEHKSTLMDYSGAGLLAGWFPGACRALLWVLQFPLTGQNPASWVDWRL